MRALRVEIVVALLVVAAMAVAYTFNDQTPVFILTVVGLPAALFLLSRDPR